MWRGAKALNINVFQLGDFPIAEPYTSQWTYWALLCEEAEADAREIYTEHARRNQST